jgi:hypothetical protein
MAKSKVVKSGKMTPVSGGKTHMFGKQHAGPKAAGITGKSDKGDGGKWGKGGPTGKVGKQGKSTPVKAR